MSEEEKINEIDNKLDRIYNDEIIINLLYQKVDLLESIIENKNNLIKSQQKEIECLKQSGEATEALYKMQIEKKDKIINLMARSWKQDDIRSVEDIIKDFEKKVEESNVK